MRKLLIPVNGDAARTKAAIAEAIRIYGQEPVAVHLLNVQPRVSGHVAMFFGEGELHQIQHTAGEEDLAAAKALLDAVGVPYTASVLVGRSAQTIARAARELDCDRIVMGHEGQPGVAGRIFGSLAEQVRHITSSASNCQVIGS
jgi:nucleotide-binding universal stress UspA family protein